MTLSRTMIPDLAVLQAFECAARHGNFTLAAAELALTQSAVSRQIKTLEDQLGVLLFERVRKRVVLSQAGLRLLPEARRLLRHSQEMVARARAFSHATDALSLACLPTFASRWLVPRLPAFMALHPGTVIDIASRAEPFDLQAEGFDLAIHYGQPVWAHAACTYLCSEVILPVGKPALIEAAALSAPGDLAGQPLLHLATRPGQWAQWFELNAPGAGDVYRGNRFDQFAMIIEAAVSGMGFALLPLYLIETELASDRLRIAFERPITTENAYYVVLPETRREHRLAQAFGAWLLTQVGTRTYPPTR